MKRTYGPMLFLLLISMFTMAFKIQSAKAGTIIVPDDYLTIQEAVSAANLGDMVFISAGTYVLNFTLVVPQEKYGITLEGAGLSAVTISAGPLLNSELIAVYSAGFTMANLTLNGNKFQQTETNTVLFLFRTADVAIENIEIVNSSGFGLYMTYPGRPSPGAIIENVTITGAGGGTALAIDGFAQDILLEHINISNCQGTGVLVHPAGGNMENLQLRQFVISNSGDVGLVLDGNWGGLGKNVSLQDVVVDNSGSFGIWALGEAWARALSELTKLS